jgi:hypothetical protein
MDPAAPAAELNPAILTRAHRRSPWTTTVAIIRVPRFNIFTMNVVPRWRRSAEPEDPLDAFATEIEINRRSGDQEDP